MNAFFNCKLCISREVGTIVRSLKCCPTEGELHDILAEVMKSCFQILCQDIKLKLNTVAIRTAPVRRLVFAIRTGVRRFHRISL